MNADTIAASLAGKQVVVVGGSRGIGRRVVEVAHGAGASVLAVARDRDALSERKACLPGLQTLALDATHPDAPRQVFDLGRPDLLILTAGARPPAAPIHEMTWEQFSTNWETDTRLAFRFCAASLQYPLAPGSTVVVVASGAGLFGSPVSGGYAGAKRTQMFIANYSQKESDRLALGLRFVALAPRMVPDSAFGAHAVRSYSHYLGIPESDVVGGMDDPPATEDVVQGILTVATDPERAGAFVVSGKGLEGV